MTKRIPLSAIPPKPMDPSRKAAFLYAWNTNAAKLQAEANDELVAEVMRNHLHEEPPPVKQQELTA